MTRDDIEAVWMVAGKVTPAELTWITPKISDIQDFIEKRQNAAPETVRSLLDRFVTAGISSFTVWYTDFYITGAYPSERAGHRPILAAMLRKLLSGALAAEEHTSLQYAKTLIVSSCDSWRIIEERLEHRNPAI